MSQNERGMATPLHSVYSWVVSHRSPVLSSLSRVRGLGGVTVAFFDQRSGWRDGPGGSGWGSLTLIRLFLWKPWIEHKKWQFTDNSELGGDPVTFSRSRQFECRCLAERWRIFRRPKSQVFDMLRPGCLRLAS